MNKIGYVLIVEDELLIAEHIASVLRNAGYANTDIAMNVAEALDKIRIHKPDLILTDIALGQNRTGIDLGKLLQTTYKVPFIYITSHATPDIIQKAIVTRPNAYLIKPFKKEDLLVAIELALLAVGPAAGPEEKGQLLIKDGHAMALIAHQEIVWLQADGNYTSIHVSNGKRRLVRVLLTDLLTQLPNSEFLRVHKSYAVNRRCITELQSGFVLLGEIKLPVGRTYRELIVNILK
jgi:two-component system response regulator LytT